MVTFRLIKLDAPMIIDGNELSYNQAAYRRLAPGERVAFQAVYETIQADRPERTGYVPDYAFFWFEYVRARYEVELLAHDVAPFSTEVLY